MSRRWLAAGMLLVAFAGGGCGGREPAVPDLAARIGDEALAYDDFEGYLEENSVDPGFGWGSDVLSALFDQFVEEELLLRLATERGLAEEGSGRRAAVESLLAAADDGISEEEIASYYRRNRARFERPERVRVQQILLPDQESVDRAQTELAAGAEFAELAERLSQVPAGAVGDAALSRDELPPAFAEAIFELEPGEVSAPVATDYGFHVFQVLERLPAGALPLSAVAAEIREALRGERSGRRLAQLVAEARERYDVQVFSRNLPFNYQGSYRDRSPAPAG